MLIAGIMCQQESAAGISGAIDMDQANDKPDLDPQLLEKMVCPLTRSPLRREGDELVGEVGGLRYPIRDGLPLMLIDEAKLPEGIASLDEFRERYADQIPD